MRLLTILNVLPCFAFPASKWMLRRDAVKSLTVFIESGHLDESPGDVDQHSSAILVAVREQTRGFKETNVNIMKVIIELFIAVCEYHESKEKILADWAAKEGTAVCIQKISDRKLSGLCKTLLTSLCVVSSPTLVLLSSCDALKEVKSPVAHEEFLKWFQTFCDEFGAASIGSGISKFVPCLLDVS